jgi:hypothetical protein
MFDRREAILEQILVVLAQVGTGWVAAVDSEPSVFRNRAEIPPEKLPALVLLDGREQVITSTLRKDQMGIVPSATAPSVYTLSPQVFIVLKPRQTLANEGVGEELSQMRMKLVPAVLDDDTLGTLIGPSGGIRYMGHLTDLQTGSTVLGQMQLNFEFSYVLNPNEFK